MVTTMGTSYKSIWSKSTNYFTEHLNWIKIYFKSVINLFYSFLYGKKKQTNIFS